MVLAEDGFLSENENKIQSVAQKDAMVRFAVWDNGEKHESVSYTHLDVYKRQWL